MLTRYASTCPYSGYHELLLILPLCPGGRHHDRRAHSLLYLYAFYLLAATIVVVIAVYHHGCFVFPRRLSVIESGSFFFAIRSDLINIGLFIGNRVFWPLSDRNRFSSRYATLVVPAIAQHNGMALLYYCCLSGIYNVAACVVVLGPQSLYLSRMKQRGHWVCWMSTNRKNGLM